MGVHLKDTLVADPGNCLQLPRYLPTQGINTPLPPLSLIFLSSLFISPHPHPWIPPTKTFDQIFYPPHTFHQVFHHQLKLHHFFYLSTSAPDKMTLVITMDGLVALAFIPFTCIACLVSYAIYFRLACSFLTYIYPLGNFTT